ncbi:hypothetical protein E2320_006644 [Naja naja]|nr:hypothetical protein E2320_006644 [Naja naja]
MKSQESSENPPMEEEVDELSLVNHSEIISRLTMKQEGDDGPDVRGGSGDILLVHATETATVEGTVKDNNKKRVSKNTFFVLVRVVDELCLVELTEEILKLLMELVFRLVCNGELSLARVLRKNILDKVDQRKMLRYTNSIKPLAARWVAARPGTLHDFHSHEISEQLTLLDAELFYKIENRGLILQDLTFVHLGNPDYIDGKVNFSKRWQQFNILDNMRRFQQVHYDIKRNDDIISFFNDFSDHLAEEALWELSLKIKPRNITRRKTDREEKT